MGASRLAALYLLALAVPLAERVFGLDLARGSCAALAVLPWLVFASAPRRAGVDGTGAIVVALFALPPLALAAALDRVHGAPPGALALALSTSWVGLLLWTLAAERAARTAGARGRHVLLWFLLVPVGLALRVALAWVPARGPRTAEHPAWLALDPLLFCHRWGRAGGLAELRPVECVFLLLGAGLALASSHLAPALARRGGQA